MRTKEKSREYNQRYYNAHPGAKEKIVTGNRLRYQKVRTEINRIKSTPCLDCQVQYSPWVMDFDHVRGHKLFEIGHNTSMSRSKLLAEIAKCDIVCSNCHRARTYKRYKESI